MMVSPARNTDGGAVELGSPAGKLKGLMARVPLDDATQRQAEALIKQCSDAELEALGLGPPLRPGVPKGLDKLPMRQRLYAVQRVISSLQYNHIPGYLYNVDKTRSFLRIMETARDVLREALPIKCIEAVFLGAYLSAGWTELDRIPIGFKSRVQGQTYRHIVLALHDAPSGKWGAVGISRRDELMFKDLVYDSLADLLYDYKTSYERWWHTLVKAYIGLPLEHDLYFGGTVCWRYLALALTKHPWEVHKKTLNRFASQARRLAEKFRALGVQPVLEASLREDDGVGGDGDDDDDKQPPPATYRSAAAASGAGQALLRASQSVSPSRRRLGQPYASAAGAISPGRPQRALRASVAAGPLASPTRSRPMGPQHTQAQAAPPRVSDPGGGGGRAGGEPPGVLKARRISGRAMERAAVQRIKAETDDASEGSIMDGPSTSAAAAAHGGHAAQPEGSGRGGGAVSPGALSAAAPPHLPLYSGGFGAAAAAGLVAPPGANAAGRGPPLPLPVLGRAPSRMGALSPDRGPPSTSSGNVYGLQAAGGALSSRRMGSPVLRRRSPGAAGRGAASSESSSDSESDLSPPRHTWSTGVTPPVAKATSAAKGGDTGWVAK